ncbi:MAG: tRNA lysidine(34) synthetase TilS [Bacillota bacterium]
MLDKVREAIRRHGMVARGDLVLVAVSGGPDSVALLDVMHRLAPELGCELAVAHLDHGLRGEESAADARFVADLADRLGLSAVIERVDLSSLTAGVQERAREARYAFFERVAGRLQAARVATGHHADDQAETVLQRFLRGGGAEGLAGIPPVRGPFIRPLLWVSKEEILAYCWEQGLVYREDPSNLTRKYQRNVLRHDLLPRLKSYNPNLVETLCNLADILRDEDTYLAEQAEEAYRQAFNAAPFPSLEARAITALPAALARRTIRRFLQEVGRGAELGYNHIETVRELISGPSGRAADLPGCRVRYDYGHLTVAEADGTEPVYSYRWTIPGCLELPEAGCRLEAELCRREDLAGEPWLTAGKDEAWLDADRLGSVLKVRSRLPGDRLIPLGMQGSKKVSDLLVDQGIPAPERGSYPIVEVTDGWIAWVAGIRPSELARITPETRLAARLRLRR